MQNYNNPDTNVFHWRKRIRQMWWSEFGGADPDRVCSDKALTTNSCAHCSCRFSGYLLFILHCSRGKKNNQNMPVLAFILMYLCH